MSEPTRADPPDRSVPSEASAEPVLPLEASAARALADLLELLGEVPSTPPILAHVSTAGAADISRLLPIGGGLGAPPGPSTIDVSASSLAAVAGLLERFGELPSTPPVVADDARDWASRLWERLEEDPPAGHHPRD